MLEVLWLTLRQVGRMLPWLAAGIIGCTMMERAGLTQALARLAQPLTRYARLSDACGVSFLTCFGSPTMANAMLGNLYTERRIEKSELMIACLANAFPMIVMHWRSMLPVMVPLLGVWGVLYFTILVVAGFIQTVVVLTAGRFLLAARGPVDFVYNAGARERFSAALFRASVAASMPILQRMLRITVPATFVAFVLVRAGILDVLAAMLKNVVGIFPIPPEGLSIVAGQFAHHVAAYTVAGNLIAGQILTPKHVILSLMTGQVLTTTINVFKWTAPHYVGIFGPRIGGQLVVISTLLRLCIMLALMALVYYVWV